MIYIKQATKKGYIECIEGGVANLSYPSSKYRRGRVIDGGRIAPTLMTGGELYKVESAYRIRKLTPRECWRLMGFHDEDFDKAKEVNSDTQLYKQAGNAIVLDVMMAVMSQLNMEGVQAWNERGITISEDKEQISFL